MKIALTVINNYKNVQTQQNKKAIAALL